MVARFAGASLGLLAFTIAIAGGVYAQNPVTVTLSRSIFALFLFSIIGVVLGTAVQMVVNEFEQKKRADIRKKYRNDVEEQGAPIEGASTGEVQEVVEA